MLSSHFCSGSQIENTAADEDTVAHLNKFIVLEFLLLQEKAWAKGKLKKEWVLSVCSAWLWIDYEPQSVYPLIAIFWIGTIYSTFLSIKAIIVVSSSKQF